MRKSAKIILVILLNTLCVGALVSYLTLAFPIFAERLDNIIYDLFLTTRSHKAAERGPVVIDIDEESMKKIGQLPWPRSVLADLVGDLLANGAKAVGLDIWLTEPDRSSPIAVASLLEKNFGLNIDFGNLPQIALDYDRYFRDEIAGKPVVLGALASFSKDGEKPADPPEPLKIAEEGEAPLADPPKMTGMIPPRSLFVNPVGLLNISVQSDGVVRFLPLLARLDDAVYPALALRTLMTALGEDEIALTATADGLDAIRVGDITIPIERDGSFRPQYLGPARSLPYYSAADVLDGKVGREELEGRILFVGASAHSLSNLRATPYDPATPGVEIHATIVDNILSGDTVRAPRYNAELGIAADFASAFLGAASVVLCSVPVYLFLLAACVLAWVGLSWGLFQSGYFFSPVWPCLALVLAALVSAWFRYRRELSEKRRLRRAFSQYVAPEVVSQIVSEGDQLLKGQRKEATVLFTDVRGFTAISEKLDPTRLARLLNCYFTPMTACVKARNGTLDKFIGDALMAFWNAPIDVANHPYQAVMAAIDMQNALAALRPSLRAEFGVELRMGIGAHTGPVHVGNMGSAELLDYTCIGENVNLASRLEGMSKRYGADIVVSETVRDACGDLLGFVQLDKIRVKGSARPMRIYAPLSPALKRDEELEKLWRKALDEYLDGDFAGAQTLFEKLRERDFLKVAALLFIERCSFLRESGGDAWDGVWTYNEK